MPPTDGPHISIDLELPAEGDLERVPPEKVDTTVLVADPDGLDLDRVEQALRTAERPRAERADVAGRVMHLAVAGLSVVAIGTDEDDQLVLDLSNTTQAVVTRPGR